MRVRQNEPGTCCDPQTDSSDRGRDGDKFQSEKRKAAHFRKNRELVHRFRNNDTTHLPVNPIGIVIYETLYLRFNCNCENMEQLPVY